MPRLTAAPTATSFAYFFTLQFLWRQATRGAFLLYLNVKFVPVLQWLLEGKRASARVLASAALALSGTALLCNDASPPSRGDAWCAASALVSALVILRFSARPALFASRSVWRALLTSQVNPGSLYRCSKSTFKRAVCGPRQEERGPNIRLKHDPRRARTRASHLCC